MPAERESLRKHLRAPFNRTVKYIFNGKPFESYAITLSEGGIFLHTTKPLPLGSRLEIDIPLGKKESMLLCGEVIYTMDRSRGKLTLIPGMAIGFDACETGIRERLSLEVKQLLAGDILEAQKQVWFSGD
jgi:Tfp pilus assembly protein PilZ